MITEKASELLCARFTLMRRGVRLPPLPLTGEEDPVDADDRWEVADGMETESMPSGPANPLRVRVGLFDRPPALSGVT